MRILILEDDLEKDFRQNDIEVYALSMFDGFDGEADYGFA